MEGTGNTLAAWTAASLFTFRSFRVGTTAGNVKVAAYDGTTPTFTNIQVGEHINIIGLFVYETGTTAVGVDVFY